MSLLIVLACVTGCREPAAFVPPPPPEVTVAAPLRHVVEGAFAFPGRTEAIERVSIRARVQGFLQSVAFTEGEPIEAGALLYTIEPEPYQAALQSAEATKAQADAGLALAQTEFNRMEDLRAQGVAARMEYERTEAALAQAGAAVLVADAAVARAKLDVGYTEIHAPIAGRTNKNLVDVGNLVGAGEATELTTIVRWDE